MSVQITAVQEARASGVLLLHACPRAVAPHAEWALSGVFGTRVELDWDEQPLVPGSLRAELTWAARRGTAGRLASALAAFRPVRFEITEDAVPGRLGERFSSTPALGMFRADIGEHGDVLVPEERLRSAMAHAAAAGTDLAVEIDRLIGTPWDAELEPFRCTHDGSVVRVLHQVG